jgi:hypothetical protein
VLPCRLTTMMADMALQGQRGCIRIFCGQHPASRSGGVQPFQAWPPRVLP